MTDIALKLDNNKVFWIYMIDTQSIYKQTL